MRQTRGEILDSLRELELQPEAAEHADAGDRLGLAVDHRIGTHDLVHECLGRRGEPRVGVAVERVGEALCRHPGTCVEAERLPQPEGVGAPVSGDRERPNDLGEDARAGRAGGGPGSGTAARTSRRRSAPSSPCSRAPVSTESTSMCEPMRSVPPFGASATTLVPAPSAEPASPAATSSTAAAASLAGETESRRVIASCTRLQSRGRRQGARERNPGCARRMCAAGCARTAPRADRSASDRRPGRPRPSDGPRPVSRFAA